MRYTQDVPLATDAEPRQSATPVVGATSAKSAALPPLKKALEITNGALPLLETVRSPVTEAPTAAEPSGRLDGDRLRAGPPATAVPASGSSSGPPSKSPAMPSMASSAIFGSGASRVGAKRTLTVRLAPGASAAPQSLVCENGAGVQQRRGARRAGATDTDRAEI